jgi:hypothetical protein
MYWRLSLPLALILGPIFSVAVLSAPAEPPGGPWPVTKQRLLEHELVSIRREPQLTWTFEEKNFVLRIDGKTEAERATKLVETLTGEKTPVSRIEGNWQLDEKRGLLVLSKIRAGGKESKAEVRLKIAGMGAVRANLGDEQYNLFPRREDKKSKKPPAPKK